MATELVQGMVQAAKEFEFVEVDPEQHDKRNLKPGFLSMQAGGTLEVDLGPVNGSFVVAYLR